MGTASFPNWLCRQRMQSPGRLPLAFSPAVRMHLAYASTTMPFSIIRAFSQSRSRNPARRVPEVFWERRRASSNSSWERRKLSGKTYKSAGGPDNTSGSSFIAAKRSGAVRQARISLPPYPLVSRAKLAISFLVPALSKAISSSVSLAMGVAVRISPVPKVLCCTVSPT